MSNDDSDDSESDIEMMFQDAHKNIMTRNKKQPVINNDNDNNNDDDDDSSNSSSSDNENLVSVKSKRLTHSSNKKRTRYDIKIEKFLNKKSKQQLIDQRNAKKLSDNDDDDDDDDDDDNDDDFNVMKNIEGTSNNNIHPTRVSTRSSTKTSTTTTTTPTKAMTTSSIPSILAFDSDDSDIEDNNNKTSNTNAAQTRNNPNHSIPNQYISPFANHILTPNSFNGSSNTTTIGIGTTNTSSIANNKNLMMMLMMQQQQQQHLQQQHIQQQQQLQQQQIQAQLLRQQLQYQQHQNPLLLQNILLANNKTSNNTNNNVFNTMNDLELMTSLLPTTTTSPQQPSLLRIKVIATIIPNNNNTTSLQLSSAPSAAPTFHNNNNTNNKNQVSVVDLTDESISGTAANNNSMSIKGSTTVSCMVDIIETATVQTLMDRILQHYLNLHLKHNVIGLQYNQEILYPKNTLDMYCIPSTGATIIATVHSCHTISIYGNNNNNSNNTTNRTTNKVNGSSFANISKKPPTYKGTVITVQLRRSITLPNGKTTDDVVPISIGNNDTLQLLVDQYQQKQDQSLSSSTLIRLQLDGDTMDLRKTPQQYDIENDDLIDVLIQ